MLFVPYLRNSYTCEFGFIHQIPTRDWCPSSMFERTVTHIIDMGFIRWSLYKTIWSKHIIVLCFESIENNQERKITKQKKKKKKNTSPIVYTISITHTTTTLIYPCGVHLKTSFLYSNWPFHYCSCYFCNSLKGLHDKWRTFFALFLGDTFALAL